MFGFVSLPHEAVSQTIAVAGSPIETIEDRDYARLFEDLIHHGVQAYFPTFQYQEAPVARSLGFEEDFIWPCFPSESAFRALRETGMKLIIPGELVYPDPRLFGHFAPETDPLKRILDCAGRDNILGITTYDEAVFQGLSLSDVAAFYTRVKHIAPDLPVYMVHGPIITDHPLFQGDDRIQAYLSSVKAFSAYADVVGFDIYPVPAHLARIASPLNDEDEVRVDHIISDYLIWLNEALPDRPTMIVLQGFSYTDLYDTDFLAKTFPSDLIEAIRAPNSSQIESMLGQAKSSGADLVVWWGPSMLPYTGSEPWPSILQATSKSSD